MMKPLIGHATIVTGTEADPLPAWRELLTTSREGSLVKLLVDVAGWAQSHPTSADAWTLLGDTYLHLKQAYAAEKAFTRALSHDSKNARAREGLGLALMQTDRPKQACKHLELAHQLIPDNPEVLIHWALALMQTGHLKPAHNRLKLALERAPANAVAWLNLGVVDTQRGAWQSAIAHFKQALAHQPDQAQAWHNLALAHRHTGELEQALNAAQRLVGLTSPASTHWVLLAELLTNAGQLNEAETALDRAMAIDTGLPAIYLARAMLYAARRQYQDAEGVLTTALVVSRDDPDMQLEMAHLHLLQQRFEKGWELHEARKYIANSPVRRFPLPEWQGEDLTGRTVLVHSEQGLGDTILFASCLPDLIARAGHVVIEVAARMADLFAHSFPTATVVGRNPQSPDLQWLHALALAPDIQIPIGDLPRHFRPSLSAFPERPAFLQADPARIEHWRQKVRRQGRPVVGLAWRGGLLQTGRTQRSLPLTEWATTLAACNVDWVSLQYGDAANDIAEVGMAGLPLQAFDEALLYDQNEVAALTCALDGVVTVCSTQAHLTGALGRPGWVLTPFSPNWRYGATGDTTSWYPSLRLLRQPDTGDWGTPMAELAGELCALSHRLGSDTPC